MNLKTWAPVIERISPERPVSLDAELAALDPRARPKGRAHFPLEAAVHMIDTPFERASTIAFGARVTAETKAPWKLAMELAILAAEKEAEPIILSHLDYSGLERFGFRVERVMGATEEERRAAEAQLISFWNIVLVI